jgi:energy-coupling factor transporter ATP-binding protein EcfA2
MASPIEDGSAGATPALCIAGLTGVGKTTLVKLLEDTGRAVAMRRVTTRLPRTNDDPRLVSCVSELRQAPGILLIEGWRGSLYAISRQEARIIQNSGHIPIIETGSISDALSVKNFLGSGLVALVERDITEQQMVDIMIQRGMTPDDIRDRIESFLEDRREINEMSNKADFLISNRFGVGGLSTIANTIVRTILDKSPHIRRLPDGD